jgi:hypothetical protein
VPNAESGKPMADSQQPNAEHPRIFCALLLAFCVTVACQEQRTEYHKRPAFYKRAATGALPDEVVLEDGTIIRYRTTQAQSSLGRSAADARAPFQMRQESPEGKVILRALLPEHVVLNTLQCVREEEYQLLYEQLLSERTKQAYEDAGKTPADCMSFFRRNRHDLAAALTRIAAGLSTEAVKISNVGDGVTRCELRPQIADPLELKFTCVDVVKEGPGLKLLMVR